MNIIDQTPYFNQETGAIGVVDRLRATMNFGADWIKEVQAQSQVIGMMSRLLDRSYTLLHSVTPPGLEASFPLILVGPPGVFVMYVTPLAGTFRAKGDQWGTITGNNFKDIKPNLLIRTERMARALQIYLQHQEQTGLTIVEAILICSDPSVHVDSLRPIIRIVMRDALERFLISITQSRVVFTPEAVQRIVDHILTAPAPEQPAPVEAEPVTNAPEVMEAQAPEEALPEPQAVTEKVLPVDRFNQLIHPAVESHPAGPSSAAAAASSPKSPKASRFQWIRTMSIRQRLLLIAMLVIWIVLVALFTLIVLKSRI